MTFYTYKPVPMGPGENIFYRTNAVSALNSFAAAGMYGRAARARRRFGRKVPGVTDINATLIAFGPIGKDGADSEGLVIQSRVEGDFNLIKSSGEISEAERKIALATNTAGVMAGPAAIYLAVKGAKEGKGSWPRGVARWAGNSPKVPSRGPKTAAARKRLSKVVNNLDSPKSRPARVAAAGLGASMVGLQLANTTGDFIAARAMKNAQRTDKES